MSILVIGGGGREHAIVKKIHEGHAEETIYVLPGNGGISLDATCVGIGAKDLDQIVAFAQDPAHAVSFAVIAPDDPLVMGLADRLRAVGIPCFGPSAQAAAIEGSKAFAKQLMRKYGIPTAAYELFDDCAAALDYLQQAKYPIVVKADGLALGKGVTVAETYDEAAAAVRRIMEEKVFGSSGDTVVIEEFMRGVEVSVLTFTDGVTIRPMLSSMDHKRAWDGDKGPNTGGMGAIAPHPLYTPAIAEQCRKTIFEPTVAALNAEGRTFRGCLYFGLMLTDDGPKVIEYNCRFGDPETQVVLPLLADDLLTVMKAVEAGELRSQPVRFYDGAACCVILASDGYPLHYESGFPIRDWRSMPANVTVFHAGDRLVDGELVTSGGRVLGVTARAADLPTAVSKAYAAASRISFENLYRRNDIGQQALSYLAARKDD